MDSGEMHRELVKTRERLEETDRARLGAEIDRESYLRDITSVARSIRSATGRDLPTIPDLIGAVRDLGALPGVVADEQARAARARTEAANLATEVADLRARLDAARACTSPDGCGECPACLRRALDDLRAELGEEKRSADAAIERVEAERNEARREVEALTARFDADRLTAEDADDIETIRTLVDQIPGADDDQTREILSMLAAYARDQEGEHDAAMVRWHERRAPEVLETMRQSAPTLWDALKGGSL